MENNLKMQTNNKYWWFQILLGIAFIGFGLWFWFTPKETYITLAVFFSVWMLINGFFEIINAFGLSKQSNNWIIYLLGGILDLIIGAILIAHENLTMEILPVFLGFWLLFRAVMLLIMCFELKSKFQKAAFSLLISAVLTGVFALVILTKPIVGDFAIVYATALAFFFMGLNRLILGTQLRK